MKANTKGKTAEVKDEIVDIHILGSKKKRFRVDGDDNKIIELNTSDLGIVDRMAEAYPKLTELEDKARNIGNSSDEPREEFNVEELKKFSEPLKEIDGGMRELVDFIFNSPVCEKCADNGTMYDVFEGQVRYEIIINSLMQLYDGNLEKEAKKIQKRVKTHTAKYTKGK